MEVKYNIVQGLKNEMERKKLHFEIKITLSHILVKLFIYSPSMILV